MREERERRECVWTADSDGLWQTGCGHSFEFTTGGPEENLQLWCGYCGGKLRPVPIDPITEYYRDKRQPGQPPPMPR